VAWFKTDRPKQVWAKEDKPPEELTEVPLPFKPDEVPLANEAEFETWLKGNQERLDADQAQRMRQWEYMRSDQFRQDCLNALDPEGVPPWEDDA